MAQATQDLVIRMKTDSQNFNEGIEKAKGKIKDFKREGEGAGNGLKDGMAVAKKAIGKIAIAIGAATAAWKTYKSMAEQSQYFSDKLNSTIEACTDTWKGLQHEILMGGNLAASQIRTLYNEAKKLAELRDELGTDVISQRFFRMKYLTPFNEGVTEYQEAKKKGDEAGMTAALNKTTKALNDYAEHSQKTIDDANKTVQQYLKKEKIDIGNKNAMDLMEELVNAQQGYFTEETKVFQHYFDLSQKGAFHNEYRDEIWSVEHPTYMTGKYGVDMPYGYEGARYAMKIKGYTKEQIDNAERQYRLSQITDEEYTQALDILETGNNVLNELTQLRRRANKLTEVEETRVPTFSNNVEKHGIEELIPQLTPKKFNGQIQFTPNAAQPLDEDWLNNEMAEYELKMLEFHDKWDDIITKTNAYGQALGNVANIFNSLASMATDDSPWKRFLTILGSVASGIMSLVQTYTSLVAVESVAQAIESGKGIPFPYNLIAIAAAGAAITGIIATIVSQTKSQKFAQGGIVGGNDYHDGIHANLSTGEMVLNKNQQARLWAMIQSGGSGGKVENVVFKIAGEDLVGVIDNYNKNINY